MLSWLDRSSALAVIQLIDRPMFPVIPERCKRGRE